MNAEQEEWRPIVDWEGIYEVSSQGRVRSVSKKHFGTYHVMAQCIDRGGYCRVHVSDKQKGVSTTALVHRFVAKAFIPNPLGLKEVNHINEVKTDNRVENLEWCTKQYNLEYGTARRRMASTLKGRAISEEHRKKIALSQNVCINQYTVDGVFVRSWDSIKDAHDAFGGHICDCLKGRRQTAAGYVWRYA